MRRSAEDLLLRALLPRLKLQTARLELVGIPPVNERALADWLQHLPLPKDESDDPIAEIGMSVTADFERWTWRAAGPAAAFIPAMGPYLVKMGATKEELDRLTHVGITLQPDRLGCWLEQRGETLNAGWLVPDAVPLAAARVALPTHPAVDVVTQWAGAFGVEQTLRLGRSMGAGQPHTEVVLSLPKREDVTEQVYAGTQLFERLEAERPPDEALSLLMNLEHGGLAVSVWLTEDGPVKLGLLAARPRTALTLELCQLAGETDQEALAALQGILNVPAPEYVECQTRASGFGVELHYLLNL